MFDRFQPLSYVAEVAANPGLRQPFFAQYRAGTVADLVAGPTDTIAVHSGFDSWIYPLYGKTLQRKIVFIETGSPIPKEADWVVVDRAWNSIWGHPDFEHTGQYRQYLGKGIATEEDLSVVRALARRRAEFQLIYHSPHVQAVFKRRRGVG
jgi:hypothetical protein